MDSREAIEKANHEWKLFMRNQINVDELGGGGTLGGNPAEMSRLLETLKTVGKEENIYLKKVTVIKASVNSLKVFAFAFTKP